MRRAILGVAAAASVLGLGLAALPAQAVTIDATYDPSITSDPNSAAIEATIQSAIAQYAQVDPGLSVSIDFAYLPLNGAHGQSDATYYTLSYEQYTSLLAAKSAADPANTVLSTALANLAYGNGAAVGNDTVWVTSADARNLGLNLPGLLTTTDTCCSGNLDGIVWLGSQWSNWSFADTVGPDQTSARNTFMHEIDEVLGIGGSGSNAGYYGLGALDLYRYSGVHTPSFTSDPNATAYFSVDGGVTPIAYFNQNPEGDSGDWALNVPANVPCYLPESIQTWKICDGQGNLPLGPTTPEGLALQSEGYSFVGVPEPSAWALLLLGVSGVGFVMRRRGLAAPVPA